MTEFFCVGVYYAATSSVKGPTPHPRSSAESL